MFVIRRLTKTGKLQKKIIASGVTQQAAWDNFNQSECHLGYPQTSIFKCLEVKSTKSG